MVQVHGHDRRLLQYARVLPWGFGTRNAHGADRFQVLAFAPPILLLAWALLSGSGAGAWLLALGSQAAGLLAERWFFFAQARHPQNIYYQAVS